jgi:membrane-anchored protein YejM (alkaline phosphatase superfamily)
MDNYQGRSQWRSIRMWMTGMVLAHAMAAMLLTASSVHAAMPPAQGVALNLFFVLALLGHFIGIGTAVGLLAMLAAACARRPRWSVGFGIGAFSLALCILLVDAKVYALYRFHLNGMVVNMVFGGALGDNLGLPPRAWVISGAIGVAIVVVEWTAALAWWRFLVHARRVSVWPCWFGAVSCMAVGQAMAAYYLAAGNRSATAILQAIPWAQPVSSRALVRRLGVKAADAPAIDDVSAVRYPIAAPLCAADDNPNIVIIVVESLRGDMLAPDVMPHTWALAQSGLRFDDHLSSGNATRFGLFGLMYGLPGAYWHAMLAAQRGPELVRQAKALGYRFAIHASASLSNPEFDRTVFAEVRADIRIAPSTLARPERDRHITEQFIAELRHPDTRPLFGFVFLDAPHSPYSFPTETTPRFTPFAEGIDMVRLGPTSDPVPLLNRYRNAVHYADGQIGRLLDAIRTSDRAANTIIVVTGDHGEEFNDLGLNYWGHNGNFSDFQVKTPFVLSWPGKTPMVSTLPSSHEDLAPTLLSQALHCTGKIADYSTGRDLFAPMREDRRPRLAESWSKRGVRYGDDTYLFSEFGLPDVLDRQYRPRKDADIDPSVTSAVWEAMTRFRVGGAAPKESQADS